jgi:hypothetical protein
VKTALDADLVFTMLSGLHFVEDHRVRLFPSHQTVARNGGPRKTMSITLKKDLHLARANGFRHSALFNHRF